MSKISGVYRITNLVNGKCYIGQSSNIPGRWRDHKAKARAGAKGHLYAAMRQYSIEMFSFEVLEKELDREKLNVLEIQYIKKYQSFDPAKGYNKTLGGRDEFTFSDEARLVMSELKQGVPKSEEHKKHISQAKAGVTFSEDHCKKISEALIGRQHAAETKLKISRSMKTKSKAGDLKKSEETKLKISTTLREKELSRSEETKNKIAKANIGIKCFTDGTRTVRSFSCPEGFWPGRCKKSRSEIVGAPGGYPGPSGTDVQRI